MQWLSFFQTNSWGFHSILLPVILLNNFLKTILRCDLLSQTPCTYSMWLIHRKVWLSSQTCVTCHILQHYMCWESNSYISLGGHSRMFSLYVNKMWKCYMTVSSAEMVGDKICLTGHWIYSRPPVQNSANAVLRIHFSLLQIIRKRLLLCVIDREF